MTQEEQLEHLQAERLALISEVEALRRALEEQRLLERQPRRSASASAGARDQRGAAEALAATPVAALTAALAEMGPLQEVVRVALRPEHDLRRAELEHALRLAELQAERAKYSALVAAGTAILPTLIAAIQGRRIDVERVSSELQPVLERIAQGEEEEDEAEGGGA